MGVEVPRKLCTSLVRLTDEVKQKYWVTSEVSLMGALEPQ